MPPTVFPRRDFLGPLAGLSSAVAAPSLIDASQNSDTIVIFQVNEATSRLSATKEIIKVASPSTIVFS